MDWGAERRVSHLSSWHCFVSAAVIGGRFGMDEETADFGSIDSGSLEQSNVSIASEFTKMIMAQRAFEANGKSITTADQDLQTVIGLKQ